MSQPATAVRRGRRLYAGTRSTHDRVSDDEVAARIDQYRALLEHYVAVLAARMAERHRAREGDGQ